MLGECLNVVCWILKGVGFVFLGSQGGFTFYRMCVVFWASETNPSRPWGADCCWGLRFGELEVVLPASCRL